MSSEADPEREAYCLYCEKEGHRTNECHSTHGLNAPRAREISRLARGTTARAALPEPVANAQWWDELGNLLCSISDNLGDMPISDDYAARTAARAHALLVANDYFRPRAVLSPQPAPLTPNSAQGDSTERSGKSAEPVGDDRDKGATR